MYESEDKMVSHPAHYLKGGMETIDVIEAFTEGLSGIEAYDTGAIIKYICRWKDKGGKQDLEKAMWYTQHLIDHINADDDDINTDDDEVNTADDAWASLATSISNLLQVAGELSDRLKKAAWQAGKTCATCGHVAWLKDGKLACDSYDGNIPSMPIDVTGGTGCKYWVKDEDDE